MDQSLSARSALHTGCPSMALRRSFLLGHSASPYSGRSHCDPVCGGCRAMESSSSIVKVGFCVECFFDFRFWEQTRDLPQ